VKESRHYDPERSEGEVIPEIKKIASVISFPRNDAFYKNRSRIQVLLRMMKKRGLKYYLALF